MTGVKPRNNRSGPGSSAVGRDRSAARGSAADMPAAPSEGSSQPQSIFSSIYAALPPMLRELLPFGPEITGEEAKQGNDQSNLPSWQDVCFIHAMPGEDGD